MFLFRWSEMSADHHQHYKRLQAVKSGAQKRAKVKVRIIQRHPRLLLPDITHDPFVESINLFRETGGSDPFPSWALNADADAGQSLVSTLVLDVAGYDRVL